MTFFFFFNYYTSKKDDRFKRKNTEVQNMHRKTECSIQIKYEKRGKKQERCMLGERAEGVNYNEGE